MKVKFMPQNIECEATPDKSLLQIATENNIEIKSICKGIPSCAECRVRILDGEGNILPPGKAELDLIGTSYFIDSRRLSCQVRCYGDVTVDLTEQIDRLANQVKKTRGFRSTKPIESKAVQDTMMLNPGEKVADQPQENHEPRQENRPPKQEGRQENREPRQDKRQGRGTEVQKQGQAQGQGRSGQGSGAQDNRPPRQDNRNNRGNRGGGRNNNGGKPQNSGNPQTSNKPDTPK
jgi:2Fe-2S ferredoxin